MTTILYVEDHPPARLLMQAIVAEMTDYTLLDAENGEQARHIATQAKPDLYILDMDLPDTNGVELSAVLHEIHPAPVIVVSAYAEAIQTGHLQETVTYYMAKPLDPDRVTELIQRALTG
ncbi:MAG: response regulator [Chloroflexota bacterium]